MTYWRCRSVLLLLLACVAADDKWVWNGNERSAKAVRTGGRVRYGVYEPDGLEENFYRPETRPPPRDLPSFIRPPPPVNQPPPFRPPPPPGIKPDLDPTSFKTCKCVHSFNCKSPGLLFGSCDTGKKYCCEKTGHGGRTDYQPDNEYPEVLAGPGGPVDNIKKPIDADHSYGLGSFAERPLTSGGKGPRREISGGFGSRPDGSLGYGVRPDGTIGYGSKKNVFPNRQEGSGGYGRPYEQRSQF